MSRIKGKDTAPELVLRSLLHRAGFRYRLHPKNLPGKPDIVLPRYRTAIFMHGCFWHRHEGCRFAYMPKTRQEFWQAKFEGTVRRDRIKTLELQQAGWQVLTVWECEIASSPENTLKAVVQSLKKKSTAR